MIVVYTDCFCSHCGDHGPHLGYLAFVVQEKLKVKMAVILGIMFKYFYHISYYANCLSYYAGC